MPCRVSYFVPLAVSYIRLKHRWRQVFRCVVNRAVGRAVGRAVLCAARSRLAAAGDKTDCSQVIVRSGWAAGALSVVLVHGGWWLVGWGWFSVLGGGCARCWRLGRMQAHCRRRRRGAFARRRAWCRRVVPSCPVGGCSSSSSSGLLRAVGSGAVASCRRVPSAGARRRSVGQAQPLRLRAPLWGRAEPARHYAACAPAAVPRRPAVPSPAPRCSKPCRRRRLCSRRRAPPSRRAVPSPSVL